MVILGSGFRGLWLATELVNLGWSVSWFQVHSPSSPAREGGFVFDEWPWQVGPQIEKSKLIHDTREFITEVIKPDDQEISVQVVTPKGPLELSGPSMSLGIKKNFPESVEKFKDYFDLIKAFHEAPDKRNKKNILNMTARFFEEPLGQRWILDWLGSLRRSRVISTQDWVLKWDGDLLDPSSHFWLLNSTLDQVVERGIAWAEKKGVSVKKNAIIKDIGLEGKLATGIEVEGGTGFLQCRRIILACSHQSALKAVPRFVKLIEPQIIPESEQFVWVRCGFYLKPGAKPQGLCEFSSFVIDPYMPLINENLGLLKWRAGEKGDSLTVWSRIPYSELKRRSFLMNLTENQEKNLSQLFPWFKINLMATFPFEEYFHSPEASHDDLAIVFDKKNKFRNAKIHLKNVFTMGTASDRGLELLSQLATESRLLTQLTEIRNKEIKRDRTLHPPRNGENMVPAK